MPAVIAAWVLFRAPDLDYAWKYLQVMAGCGNNALFTAENIFMLREYALFLVAGIIFAIPVLPYLAGRGFYLDRVKNIQKRKVFAGILEFSAYVSMVLVFLLAISFVVKNTNNPFIYFNF